MKLQAGPNWRTTSEDPADCIIVGWGHMENIIAATYFRRSPATEVCTNWESGKSEDAPVPAVRQVGHRKHNRSAFVAVAVRSRQWRRLAPAACPLGRPGRRFPLHSARHRSAHT